MKAVIYLQGVPVRQITQLDGKRTLRLYILPEQRTWTVIRSLVFALPSEVRALRAMGELRVVLSGGATAEGLPADILPFVEVAQRV